MPRLPKGFGQRLKELHRQGYSPQDAMKEAWREVRGENPIRATKRCSVCGRKGKLVRDSQGKLFCETCAREHKNPMTPYKKSVSGYPRPLRRHRKIKRYTSRAKFRHERVRGKNPILKKYAGREGEGNFRAMTLDEAKNLQSGQHVWVLDRQGGARRAKVNGRVKRWKREPDRIEIPLKYGMYEYFTLDQDDVVNGELLIELESNPVKRYGSRAKFRHERVRSPRGLHHLRTVTVGKHRVIIGCPVATHKGRCPVGTVTQAILHPKKERKNPIAVYNPRGKHLPLSNVEIRYQRSGGEYSGQWFRHAFHSSVNVYGLDNGGILIKSKSGKKLWGTA